MWRFRLSLAIAVVLYAWIMEYAYVNFIATKFGYLKYYYEDPNRILMSIGLCFHVIAGWTLKRRWQRPSDVVAWLTFGFVVLPIGIVPFFSGAISEHEAFIWSIGVAMALVVMNKMWSVPTLSVVPIHFGGSGLLWSFLIGVSILTYGMMATTVGLSLDVHSLFNVYDARDDYKASLAGSSALLGYLVSNQGNVVNPLLMALGAKKRNFALIGLGIVGQLLIYSLTGFKTVFLSVPVAIGLGWFLSTRAQPRSLFYMHTINAVSLLSILIDSVKDISIVQIVVNRLLVTSGYLMAIYADYYTDAPKHMWSYSFLSKFVETPYNEPPAAHLGIVYFNIDNLVVNANLFADGFANLGVGGILIEAFVLVAAVLLLNSAARGVPLSVVAGTLLLPVIALANGSPITALLSYGLLMSGVVFALYPRDPQVAGLD